MDVFYLVYVNLIRAAVLVLTAVCLFKRDNKKIASAAVTLALTAVPWALSLFGVNVTALTGVLYASVVFMGMFLGSGYRWYDRFAWWDRLVHFLSGFMFFSFGVTLAGKAPDAGFAGTLAFGFVLSLALHGIWEILEYLADCVFHSDNQRWQLSHPNINHKSYKTKQPAGLADTMNDAIAGLAGTIVALIGWWIMG